MSKRSIRKIFKKGSLVAAIFLTMQMAQANELDTYVVESKTIEVTLPIEGVIEATNRAVMSAQTAGRILELPFDVGDTVNEGDMIVSITSNEQRAGFEAALAQVSSARSQSDEANTQFVRIAELYDKKMVSKTDFDRSKAQNDSAQAAVKAAEAGLKRAKQTLAYTEVYAPYSGIVVRRLVEVGESVAPGTPLLEGLSLNNLRVRVDLPQLAAEALRANGSAEIILDNGMRITPSKIRISPMANNVSHTFNALLDLPNNIDPSGLPGSLVKVSVVLNNRQTTVIPSVAVAKRGDIDLVYVNSGDAISIRYIRLGRKLKDGSVEIVSGLSEGDRIYIDPITAAATYKNMHN